MKLTMHKIIMAAEEMMCCLKQKRDTVK